MRTLSVTLLLGSAFIACTLSPVAAQTVPPPSAGLGSKDNYYLYNDGNPIHGLIVKVELTKDVVCDNIGFHIQLNANSPTGKQTNWQQYVMGFNPNFVNKGKSLGPVVGSSIEYFSKPNDFDTSGKQPPNDGSLTNLPGPRTLPAGAVFTIAIQYDGDDVSGAKFSYAEKGGKNKHEWTIPVPPPTPPYPKPVVPAAVRTPIVAFQLDIVGRSGGDKAVMQSGEGKIVYSASDAMTVVNKKPKSNGATTAETANSAYGELPPGPSKTFTQSFSVVQATAK